MKAVFAVKVALGRETQLAIALYAVQVRGHKTLHVKTYMETKTLWHSCGS